MREYALILISTVFVNNFVLVKFLGLCPFMGVSRKYGASFGMGLATTLVLMVTSALTYLTETYILAPLEITYLRTIAYIFVIALVVQTRKPILSSTGSWEFTSRSSPRTASCWDSRSSTRHSSTTLRRASSTVSGEGSASLSSFSCSRRCARGLSRMTSRRPSGEPRQE